MTHWHRIESPASVTYTLRDEYLFPRADGGGLQQFRVTFHRTLQRMTVTQDEPPYQASAPIAAWREMMDDVNIDDADADIVVLKQQLMNDISRVMMDARRANSSTGESYSDAVNRLVNERGLLPRILSTPDSDSGESS